MFYPIVGHPTWHFIFFYLIEGHNTGHFIYEKVQNSFPPLAVLNPFDYAIEYVARGSNAVLLEDMLHQNISWRSHRRMGEYFSRLNC